MKTARKVAGDENNNKKLLFTSAIQASSQEESVKLEPEPEPEEEEGESCPKESMEEPPPPLPLLPLPPPLPPPLLLIKNPEEELKQIKSQLKHKKSIISSYECHRPILTPVLKARIQQA